MAEFITHKVQVALTAACQGEQADHLVQGDSPVNHRIVAILVHVGVHVGAGQTEDHGLVAHQCLVVGFHIGDGILTGTAQAHLAPHLVDIPEFILALYRPNPHIRQTHTQTVVKADTAVGNGQRHAGHTGHILRNGDGIRVHLTDQLVGKLQIGDGLGVGIEGEVLVVGVEVSAQAMVVVEHGGDAVKTETVKVVLGHPELQVAEQEMEHTGSAVVEALGAPGGMVTLAACVEELPFGAVKHIDALGGVLDCMGVHHIQQHPDAHFMGLVHQILQILRLAKPGGRGKEIGDLIAEGAIIGMLHNGHELDGVVAGLLHMGQDIVGKLPVRAYLALLLRHTHMGFVDVHPLLTPELAVRPWEDLFVIGDLSGEGDGLGVLHHPAGIQGDVLGAGHVGVNNSLDLAAFP